MAPLKHNLLYKHFYQLVVFLLTLPVTSASCERAHSKVNIVKSAVRSSMNSERLEDFILISSEKTVLDSIELAVIVDNLQRQPGHCLYNSRNNQTVRAVQRRLGLVISLRVNCKELKTGIVNIGHVASVTVVESCCTQNMQF